MLEFLTNTNIYKKCLLKVIVRKMRVRFKGLFLILEMHKWDKKFQQHTENHEPQCVVQKFSCCVKNQRPIQLLTNKGSTAKHNFDDAIKICLYRIKFSPLDLIGRLKANLNCFLWIKSTPKCISVGQSSTTNNNVRGPLHSSFSWMYVFFVLLVPVFLCV